jgi:peptidyl-prolyl cis-trans isomerase C
MADRGPGAAIAAAAVVGERSMIMYRKILMAAALVLALGSQDPARAQTAAADAPGDQVVGIVDGDEIRKFEVEMLYQGLPQQFRQLPRQVLYAQLLDRLVQRKLAARAARQAGLNDDVEVKRRMAFLGDAVLQERFLLLRIRATLTDARLRAAYEKMTAGLPAGEEVRASHILMKTEEAAKAVIAELAAGADFAATAKARSTGPSASNGGDLGFFGKDQMVKEFAAAAFALETGAITQTPVKTQFGWHVIKLEERRQAPPPSFEESLDKLRDAEARLVVDELNMTLRENADIKLFNPDGSDLLPPPAAGGATTP